MASYAELRRMALWQRRERLAQIDDSLNELRTSRREAQDEATRLYHAHKRECGVMRDCDDMIRQLTEQRRKLEP